MSKLLPMFQKWEKLLSDELSEMKIEYDTMIEDVRSAETQLNDKLAVIKEVRAEIKALKDSATVDKAEIGDISAKFYKEPPRSDNIGVDIAEIHAEDKKQKADAVMTVVAEKKTRPILMKPKITK